MQRKNILIIGAALSLALTATSCRKHGYLTEPLAVPVTSIKVTPQSIQLTAIGDGQQIGATIAPANATDQTIVWESTDSTIASVDQHGRVTAKAFGFGVLITAYSHDRQHEASVNVSVNR